MRIVLSGGTGFIGKALLSRLVREGHQILLLSRNPERTPDPQQKNVTAVPWDAREVGPWAQSVDGADAVINLSGENIAAKRWTAAQKARILQSRLAATKAIVSAIERAKKAPPVLVNASAVGYYGDVPEGDVTESHPRGKGFLAEVCEQWEKEALVAKRKGVRVVLLRTGIVLEKGGGAIQKMLPPFLCFLGGPLGSGRQWFPWIHLEDEVGAILYAIKNSALSGPVNAVSPHPVRLKDFCSAFARVLHRPSWLPVPAFALRMLLGEIAEMLLTGQRALPRKLEQAGYPFQYPSLHGALASIVSRP